MVFSIIIEISVLYYSAIHNESVYFEGKVRVACSMLYPIFRFWNF